MLRARMICSAACAGGVCAAKWRAEPTLGYTHLQPAQLTTVGKRATLWMQDLVLDLADLDYRVATLPFRGIKGTTGTQASFLELFNGDHDKVRELDRRVTQAMGFGGALPVTGQTYSRKLDAQVLASWRASRPARRNSAATSGCCRHSARSRSHSRPSRSGRRPWRTSGTPCAPSALPRSRASCSRSKPTPTRPTACSISSARSMTAPTGASCSRRAFLAADAILVLMANIAAGLEVHPARIRQRVEDELPFMATEELIVRGGPSRRGPPGGARNDPPAQHGGGACHEGRRRAATTCWSASPRTRVRAVAAGDLRQAVDASRYHRTVPPEQVDEFLATVIAPALARDDAEPGHAAVAGVRV